jgi:pentatricopeptide repeat protein
MKVSSGVSEWNALIAAQLKRGQAAMALQSFRRMQVLERHAPHSGGHGFFPPDAVSFTLAFKACGILGDMEQGKQIHAEAMQRNLLLPGRDAILATALVGMYSRCGSMGMAEQAFLELLPRPNLVSWNVLISGYANQGPSKKALDLFAEMKARGCSPDAITFSCLLKACADLQDAEKGSELHDAIVDRGLLSSAEDPVLGTALVDMYAKCGAMAKAERAFDELLARNAASWNAIISGYLRCGESEEALHRFLQMQREGFDPDGITLTSVLKACGSTWAIETGKQIHDDIVRRGFLEQDFMLGTALVDMYAKCGMLDRAEEVFNKLAARDVVSWNALISGYAHQGKAEEAFACFQQMRSEGILADAITFISVLMACGSKGAIHKGSHIHQEIVIKELLGKDTLLDNALLDMYSTSGSLMEAEQALDRLHVRDIVSWNVLIAGYAQQALGEEAMNCFGRLRIEGLLPDAVTLVSLLTACSHSGLVDEGEVYFMEMTEIYGITPIADHYACMVDLYGRAGNFEKVMVIIIKMPFSETPALWDILLGACRKWGNGKLGRLAFEQAVELDDLHVSRYIVMAHIQTVASMIDDPS